MSKDLTPRELHILDFMHYKEHKQHLYDLKFTIKSGDNVIQKDDYLFNNSELRKRYPNFSFYFSQIEDITDEEMLRFLDVLEAELSQIIKADELTGFSDRYLSTETEHPFLLDWYNGKLDPNFYYSTVNNDIFLEHIKESAKENS